MPHKVFKVCLKLPFNRIPLLPQPPPYLLVLSVDMVQIKVSKLVAELQCFGVPYKFIPFLPRSPQNEPLPQFDFPCCWAHLGESLFVKFISRQMYSRADWDE